MAGGIVIVGAGQGGVQVAEQVRAAGFDGPVTLLGDEPGAPYHRPPLSKGWLSGETVAAQLVMRAPEALARKGIDFRPGTRVAALDPAGRRVRLADGSTLPYDGLALATGAQARRLALPGADAAGVHTLRTRADAEAIAARLAHCAAQALPVVVIGGGYIGLEVAATARKKGLEVTVLEALPRLLARVAAPALASWVADLHRHQGVTVRCEARVHALAARGGEVAAVVLADGTELPAGLVVAGIGALPDDALARAAGLPCACGVIVDACARTADPAIVAVGDCAARRLDDGSLLRLESIHNAGEQAKSAAAALLGRQRPFAGTPWFWSDQYDAKLQMAGLAAGADRTVTRGSPGAGPFALFHFAGTRLVAVDTVNAPREHLAARKLLDAGRSPSEAQAADPSFDLASLLA